MLDQNLECAVASVGDDPVVTENHIQALFEGRPRHHVDSRRLQLDEHDISAADALQILRQLRAPGQVMRGSGHRGAVGGFQVIHERFAGRLGRGGDVEDPAAGDGLQGRGPEDRLDHLGLGGEAADRLHQGAGAVLGHGDDDEVGEEEPVGAEVTADQLRVGGGGDDADRGVGMDRRDGRAAALQDDEVFGAGVGQLDAGGEGAVDRGAGEPAAAPAGADGDDAGGEGVLQVVAGGVAAAFGQRDQAFGREVERGRVDQLGLGGAAPAHGDDDRRCVEGAGQVGGHRRLPGALPCADDGDASAWWRHGGGAEGRAGSRRPGRRRRPAGPARPAATGGGRRPPARRRGRRRVRARSG